MARLNKSLDTNYTEMDEDHTTLDSKDFLRELNGKMKFRGIQGSKNLQDGFAAVVILKRFMDYYHL